MPKCRTLVRLRGSDGRRESNHEGSLFPLLPRKLLANTSAMFGTPLMLQKGIIAPFAVEKTAHRLTRELFNGGLSPMPPERDEVYDPIVAQRGVAEGRAVALIRRPSTGERVPTTVTKFTYHVTVKHS
ncbi:hypothetical protein CGC21_1875 [Leishmania donovani]|uniref:Uncharacterized protein n=1 Tax=Leishmania donovani TaxID=5661 RepID=A0A504XH01_LEIDO|nr:hypothetical protein CGC21_1875 [Leishmania donovani]